MKVRIAITLALLVAAQAQADVATSKDVVKASAKVGKVDKDGTRTVVITLKIDKPYHLYANPVGEELLESAQTTVKFDKGIKVVKVDYPLGKPYDAAGMKIFIYEGEVAIKAKIMAKSTPIKMSVRVQACTDKECLIGADVKLTAK